MSIQICVHSVKPKLRKVFNCLPASTPAYDACDEIRYPPELMANNVLCAERQGADDV
jgi:hypothetical protein